MGAALGGKGGAGPGWRCPAAGEGDWGVGTGHRGVCAGRVGDGGTEQWGTQGRWGDTGVFRG